MLSNLVGWTRKTFSVNCCSDNASAGVLVGALAGKLICIEFPIVPLQSFANKDSLCIVEGQVEQCDNLNIYSTK